MAQERPNRLAELLALARQGLPTLREQARMALARLRAEPGRVWEVAAVRYAVYGLVGLIATWILAFVVGLISPPPPPGARDPARSADFRIVCGDPQCGYNYVLRREFGYEGFPAACHRCKKVTGVPGRRCFSPRCEGRWIAPVESETQSTCPVCGNVFPGQP